jgi:hypothetical protein
MRRVSVTLQDVGGGIRVEVEHHEDEGNHSKSTKVVSWDNEGSFESLLDYGNALLRNLSESRY